MPALLAMVDTARTAAPALPRLPANLQVPKGVRNPDTSQVLAHLYTKCSIVNNDHNDNSAYYYCYCSSEKKKEKKNRKPGYGYEILFGPP